jgi:adenylylsulfate kinase
MLIAMAGLPGTGKSTLAERLRHLLGGVVLNKDRVREVLFPPPVLDYSTEQNDLSMKAIYSATGHILRTSPGSVVLLDGRTFLRSAQVADLLALGAAGGLAPRIIECVCADEVARQRLESDQARGGHPAGNRTYALYLELKAAAEPLTIPHLVIDTGKPLEECVQRCLDYLRSITSE